MHITSQVSILSRVAVGDIRAAARLGTLKYWERWRAKYPIFNCLARHVAAGDKLDIGGLDALGALIFLAHTRNDGFEGFLASISEAECEGAIQDVRFENWKTGTCRHFPLIESTRRSGDEMAARGDFEMARLLLLIARCLALLLIVAQARDEIAGIGEDDEVIRGILFDPDDDPP
jgi:hypothetical protein